jgi:UDP-glucose 4-epimerase
MNMDLSRVGPRRNLTMPGLSAPVAEQIEALRRAAGDGAGALIRREPDPVIDRIVAGWATRFDARRAIALGFAADASFDAIIAAHIEDELGGRPARSG